MQLPIPIKPAFAPFYGWIGISCAHHPILFLHQVYLFLQFARIVLHLLQPYPQLAVSIHQFLQFLQRLGCVPNLHGRLLQIVYLISSILINHSPLSHYGLKF